MVDLDFLSQCKETMKLMHANKDMIKFNGKSMYLQLQEQRDEKKTLKEPKFKFEPPKT